MSRTVARRTQCAGLSLLAGLAAILAGAGPLDSAVEAFRAHYAERLGAVEVRTTPLPPDGSRVEITSPKLRGPGNAPVLLTQGGRSSDAIVLIHGLTDSPYYMEAIGRAFHAAGVSVVLPLLPAHGLEDPDAAMEDDELSEHWKACVDHAVSVAALLGDRVSIGGLSTGGALSVNETLRAPDAIGGGVFLFSAALSIGTLNQLAGHTVLVLPAIAKKQDGLYRGDGPNPYKYPRFTNFGGLQLARIINENDALLARGRFPRPVFAAHSIHDTSALIQGIGDLFRRLQDTGIGIVIAHDPPVEHASVVLAEDIPLDLSKVAPGEEPPGVPRANPVFRGMTELAVRFLRRYVQGLPAPADGT